ncbi:polyprenol monophosphomannose synthase [Oceanidesulfovibrio indonesiensis]|uniref:Polyprenol monophosphomannose synthase n=1 Tax=Oceanidesulfovibrio indonesiensis TaxID=54767 RepID=A0A7M3M9Y2_9BACT|nr:polyprenol monophosphomannose synthase [Oceanidesulfovibrio indonesiensis]TVM14016.1 polyprenol monophosphomannose synthase [Oceanidesulfovibrio indonesiensis]
MQTAVIVLPTYSEAENVQSLLPQLFAQQVSVSSHTIHVLVVDDDSPDGTADAVRKLQPLYPALHLLNGAKRGLGEAYKRGFAHALREFDPDLILQMDADWQHDPTMLPVLIDQATRGYDLVIGSRYTNGGATPNFSLRRRLISRLGNWLVRTIGKVPEIRDCTSGYRCIKADPLRECDFNTLPGKGYSFQASLLLDLVHNGANVREMPIVFPDRTKGASKLGLGDQVEFCRDMAKMLFR